MNRSLRLFSINGIDLRLHITFPIILIWAAYQFGTLYGSIIGAIFGIVAITLLFVLVTLHELGHSFAALYYQVPVKQIVLSPIGGVAQLSRMPDKPTQELVISIAGPAVNVIIAILMAGFALALGLNVSDIFNNFSGGGVTFLALFSYVFIYNAFLAIFNLIPAFPMDGGRVFRALLALRLDYLQATNIAALVGRIFAILLAIYGFVNGNFFQILIAFFIFGAATQEARYTRVRHTNNRYSVKQAYAQSALFVNPEYTLQQAHNLSLYSGQKSFAVVYGGYLAGLLTQSALDSALRINAAYSTVGEVMLLNIEPLSLDTGLFDAQSRLVQENLDALPVVNEEGKYLGLLTRGHIAELQYALKNQANIIPGTQSV